MLEHLINEINKLANENKAKISQGFFKTGKGYYSEVDVFLGLTVPEQRNIAKKFIKLDFDNIKKIE